MATQAVEIPGYIAGRWVIDSGGLGPVRLRSSAYLSPESVPSAFPVLTT
ncbi:hypothetical protein [Nonomuraea turcica]|nr:hypothetical protein [Nonomuraea sp. G32]MDP4507301.1 hypothetical protein [Nonomuraea sp. G32]